MWKRLGRHPFALRTVPDLLFHTLVVVCSAVLMTAIIVPAVVYAYPDVNAAFLTCVVMGNTTVFPLVLGIPMAIVLQEELGFSPYAEKPSEG